MHTVPHGCLWMGGPGAPQGCIWVSVNGGSTAAIYSGYTLDLFSPARPQIGGSWGWVAERAGSWRQHEARRGARTLSFPTARSAVRMGLRYCPHPSGDPHPYGIFMIFLSWGGGGAIDTQMSCGARATADVFQLMDGDGCGLCGSLPRVPMSYILIKVLIINHPGSASSIYKAETNTKLIVVLWRICCHRFI